MFEIEMGAALLDEKFPGWDAKIDVNLLDLTDCSWCVLGQLFGRYMAGLRALGIYDGVRLDFAELSVAFGFNKNSIHDTSFDDLKSGWETLILERRNRCQNEER
jgi:hypothetical protein